MITARGRWPVDRAEVQVYISLPVLERSGDTWSRSPAELRCRIYRHKEQIETLEAQIEKCGLASTPSGKGMGPLAHDAFPTYVHMLSRGLLPARQAPGAHASTCSSPDEATRTNATKRTVIR